MFASVIIDQDIKALNKVFEYLVPEGVDVKIGARVCVPFGQRTLQGFVIDLKENCDYDAGKIKKIYGVMEDFALIKPELIKLMGFMCDEFHLRQTSVLRLLVPSEIREGKVKELFEKYAVLGDFDLESLKRAKKQQQIIEKLKIEKRLLFSVFLL